MLSWPATVDLRRLVSPGDTVAWTHGGAEPTALVGQFLDQAPSFAPVDVFLTGLGWSDLLQPRHAECIRFRGIGGLGTHQRLARAGCLDVVPCRLADLPRLIASRRLPIDVCFVLSSPPDRDGNVNLGPTVAVTHELLGAARVAVLEVNPRVPAVRGSTTVPLSRFDAVVSADHALVEAAPAKAEVSPVVAQICEHIAALVPDGATLQVGIGAIASAIPRFLGSRRNLGIHSGLISDPLLELMESGAVTGSSKEVDPGLAVAGELVGSARLYRSAAANPAVSLQPTAYLSAESVLGRFETFVSINSALEVDLAGQVNAEVQGGVTVGAIGGQVDFVRAAARAPHGRSVIALPSVTGKGRSRIVAQLDGGTVTTARSEVELVVTEYGVADLAGRSLSQRAAALIDVAHPDHRDALRRASG
jgi:acetyl-CoA hydrolase